MNARQMVSRLEVNHSVALRNAGYAAVARQVAKPCPECGGFQRVMDDHPLNDMTAPTYSDCPVCVKAKPAPICEVYGAEHQFEFVREDLSEQEFWECECGAKARNARDYGLPLKPEN